MPHDPHRYARVNVERGQQGRAGVPCVMDANGSYASPGTSSGEAAIEVTWIDGGADLGGEHEVVSGPDLTERFGIRELVSSSLLQGSRA